jgi:hypothetical protein
VTTAPRAPTQFVLFVTSQYDNYIREEGMGNVRRTEECKQNSVLPPDDNPIAVNKYNNNNISMKTARSDHLERLYLARWIILKAKNNSALTQSGP